MNTQLQRAKGVRDFGPEEKIFRDKIVALMTEVFESYGYSPIETPVLERYSLFASKFGPGEQSDAMKETFKLEDQGGRRLVLRNEFTAPFARFVGMNPTLKMPFKRYQIGQIFRDGPIKLGRYREFWQADIDIVGVSEPAIEAELVMMAQKIFKALGLDVVITLNNRKLLNGVLKKFGVKEKEQSDVLIAIDKLDKIGAEGVTSELAEKDIKVAGLQDILTVLATDGKNETVLGEIEAIVGKNEGIEELRQILRLVGGGNVKINPSMVRGQAYYTGTIFEVFLKDTAVLSSSLAAGGRYDNMIGGFTGQKNEQIPAVGLSFGLETVMDALAAMQDKDEGRRTVADVYAMVMNKSDLLQGLKIADKIRTRGYNVDFDLQVRKLKKNFEYADALGIPYVVVLGEDELQAEKITVKNMRDGSQQTVKVEDFELDLQA